MHSENQWRFVNTLASTSNESEIHCLAVMLLLLLLHWNLFFRLWMKMGGSGTSKEGSLPLNNSQKNWNFVPNNLLYYLWDDPLHDDHLILLKPSMFLKINQAFTNDVSWVWKKICWFCNCETDSQKKTWCPQEQYQLITEALHTV